MAPAKKSTDVERSAKAAPAKAPVKTALVARAPSDADRLKAQLGALSQAISNVRALRRSLAKNYYDIGTALQPVVRNKTYEAKGYSSFDTFAERELDLGKQLASKLVRIVEVFQKAPATAAGLDRVLAALAAFEGEQLVQTSAFGPPTTGPSALSSAGPRQRGRRS